MEFLNSWMQAIIISVIIATIIEMILPNGNSKKYIKVVLGVYIVFNIITPIVNKLSNNNFEISSIINIEEYMQKMETYEVASETTNITGINEANIKQIYISKIEKDIKSKLEEKNYSIKEIQVEVENSEEYKIKNVEIYLYKENKQKNTNEAGENLIHINEIETINIQIGNEVSNNTNNEKNYVQTESSKISEKEERDIKEYISSVYEVKENQIAIF